MFHRSRKLIRTITCSGMFLALSLASAQASDPTGDWRVADGVANIRIAACNGSLWGVVAWEKTPGGRDTNNPDVSKQNRPTLGMPILLDMKKAPDADQWDGEVYNAKDGQTYSAAIKPVDPDHLEIQGCVLGFLCGGETWTRISAPIPSPAMAAKDSPKMPGAASKTGRPTTRSGAPDTTGSVNSSGKPSGSQSKPADPIGDICLLPDVARLAH
jgi:uncharacterized protein (DUF2147 family)